MVYIPGSTLDVDAHDFYAIDGDYALPHGVLSSFFVCQWVHQEVQKDAPLKDQKKRSVDAVGVEFVAIAKV
jgi:hypothetical protein